MAFFKGLLRNTVSRDGGRDGPWNDWSEIPFNPSSWLGNKDFLSQGLFSTWECLWRPHSSIFKSFTLYPDQDQQSVFSFLETWGLLPWVLTLIWELSKELKINPDSPVQADTWVFCFFLLNQLSWTFSGQAGVPSQCPVYPGLGCGHCSAGSSSLLLCPCPFSRASSHLHLWSQELVYHLGPVLFPGPWTVRASCSWVSLGSCLGPAPWLPSFVCSYFSSAVFLWIVPVVFHVWSSGLFLLWVCHLSDRSRTHFASHCPPKSQGSPCT